MRMNLDAALHERSLDARRAAGRVWARLCLSGRAGRFGIIAVFALALVAVAGSALRAQSAGEAPLPSGAGGAAVSEQADRTAETDAIARAAMFRLRSPVTPSHTLDMCPAAEAEALRDTLRIAAAYGETVDELVEGVIARYGEQMRILPKRSGAGLWAWILPPAVLLFGAGLVVARLRALRRGPGDDHAETAAISDEDRELLETALAELESTGAEDR